MDSRTDKITFYTPRKHTSWFCLEECLGGRGVDMHHWGALYLVRWQWKQDATHTHVHIVMVPDDEPEKWLDDLVRERSEQWEIIGCVKLSDVELPPYEIPVEYRKECAELEEAERGSDS